MSMNTAQISSSSSDERRGKDIEAEQLLSKVLLRVYGVCNPYRFKKRMNGGVGWGNRGNGGGGGVKSTAVNQLSSLLQNYRKEEMMEGQEVMRKKKDEMETTSEG